MGGAMLFFQVLVPLLLVATPSSSEKSLFDLRGGSIVLQAEQVTRVSSIIWKHNKDKAAEWFEGDDAPTYYNKFKSDTTLDMQTWALKISNLQPHFSGKYSAEVNNKDPTQFVTLTLLEKRTGFAGGSIVLQAEKVTRVSSIIWKHNNNKAAHWFEGDDAPTYYNKFKYVTTLDMQTWALTISNLQPHFSGIYSAQVNKDPTQFVTLTVIEKVFVLRGGSIVLQAEEVTSVSSIIWRHNKDKAAEWFEGDDAPTYYFKFISDTTLDMRTWTLKISNLQPHFSGKYSAEVNSNDPTQFVTLTVIEPVSKPTITMDCIDTICTLTCQGKEDGFTTYTWANGIEEWPGFELTVERRDHDVVYTCNISNPVSWASSQETVQKHVPPPPDPGPGRIIGGIIAGINAGLIIYAGICLLVFKKQGNTFNALRTMTCRDRCRIFIPCIKVTPPVPSREVQNPEVFPLRQSVTGDKKPPEANPPEGKQTENGLGSTADGEH